MRLAEQPMAFSILVMPGPCPLHAENTRYPCPVHHSPPLGSSQARGNLRVKRSLLHRKSSAPHGTRVGPGLESVILPWPGRVTCSFLFVPLSPSHAESCGYTDTQGWWLDGSIVPMDELGQRDLFPPLTVSLSVAP